MGDPLYRFRQFFRALRARPLTPQENERVRAVLTPHAFALYQSMPAGDQRHSLRVFDALCAQGYTARPLLQAALLHDVAKRQVGLVYRTGVILLQLLSPRAVAQVASANPASWRYPFYLALHHPTLGVRMLNGAELDPCALALIRAHQAQAPVFRQADAALLAEWHRVLQRADDMN